MTKISYQLNQDVVLSLFGNLDQNVRTIQTLTGATIKTTSSGIELTALKEPELAKNLVEQILLLLQNGFVVNPTDIERVWKYVLNGESHKTMEQSTNIILHTAKGNKILAKTQGQLEYVQAIRDNTVVFGVGPAGTGKTYLAVAMAINALKKKEISKIILTRPAIEAGEKLGFLPGDMQQKVDPYLRPLYDSLEEFTGEDSYLKLIEKGQLEIAPLAYMRGRTLNKSFIILDEAQNATDVQLKMFLTRFGIGSKVVVTGDLTQIDLPNPQFSGLQQAIKILDEIPDIAIVKLQALDIVRHPLVQKIVEAYGKRLDN
ncbi:MAG: PhoH family protein [Firmicutes bacterium]|nr:PhoH family protein [Bacillota bacterium]MCL1953683.1 PhoH family protein [Bacillota bacterium]